MLLEGNPEEVSPAHKSCIF
jgi:acidic leucine-rich nuclear phosphoprotein 32 family member A/C/D